jgi:SAM-dependent MidA family methyltransferase
LAFDILEAIEDSEPKLFRALEYWIVEPSAAQREVQQKSLSRFPNVRWFAAPREIQGKVNGVFFSNELLDAMPVHVFRWNRTAHQWNEMGVSASDDGFVWETLAAAMTSGPQFPDELLEVLPDGFVFEVASSETRQWWADAAGALASGKLMAIDYGGTLEELLLPVRTAGTLRAYSEHRVSGNVLENPGDQDITAHVNFSVIRHVGEQMRLRTEAFVNQSLFLTNVARELWTRRGLWPQHQVRQFQTLTHPEHLGRPFRILVQSR